MQSDKKQKEKLQEAMIKEERVTQQSSMANQNGQKDSALIIDFKSSLDGRRYLGGEHYVDFVLQSEICLPGQKVEAVMKQALQPDHANLKIDSNARALVQVAVTEFICFITSDIIEELSKEKRVAIKEQDIIESVDKMGYE